MTAASDRGSRVELPLLGALAVAGAVPFWLTEHIPTQDGPSHMYNAQVLLGLLRGAPELTAWYELNLGLFPNWAGHAVLGALMLVAPALVAEKLLLTGYAIALPLAARYAVRSVHPGAGAAALLALPMVHCYPLYMGFYSFCLSVPVCLLALGYWWRHREALGPRRVAALALLLLALYLCHIVTIACTLFVLVVLAVALLRTRILDQLRTAAAMVPAALLLGRYLLTFDTRGPGAQPLQLATEVVPLLRELLWGYILYSFTPAQVWIGRGFCALLSAGAVLEGVRRLRRKQARPRAADALLLAAGGLTVIYLVAPGEIGSGGWVSERFEVLIPLLLLPWLALPRAGALRWGWVALAAALALAATVEAARVHRQQAPLLVEYTAGLEAVTPGSAFLPLHLRHNPRAERVTPAFNASSYYALDRDAINWANYETQFDYFPVRFRPDVHLPRHELSWTHALLFRPAGIAFCDPGNRVDHLVVWNREPEVEQAYEPCFQVSFQRGRLTVLDRVESAPDP